MELAVNEMLHAAHAAEQAAEYVLARVKAQSGHRFHQGERRPPLACASASPGEALRFFAEQRLHRVPTSVARALLAWSHGFPVELTTSIPDPLRVLELQARGERCVSLLPDGVPTGHHRDALAFALHDLCHLDKFMEPDHYLGQIGFFACLYQAARSQTFVRFDAQFDQIFREDFAHVASDMNGSAVFLFATLKMKLKMAVRRRHWREQGTAPREGGPLTDDEREQYDAALLELTTMLGLSPMHATAARAISTKRDEHDAALLLLRHFEDVGRQIPPRRAAIPCPANRCKTRSALAHDGCEPRSAP